MSGQWSPLRLTTEGRPSAAIAVALLALYAAGTLYVGLHHEPWRDEADSWLVVRDAPLSTIFTWTRNAGTPALWYLTLKPLIWLGLPYQSQQLLHLAFAWAAAAILLLRAPFTWITKLLVLGSYYLAYEYAVIARSYVLTILLSFLIAAWYPERHSRSVRYAVAVALLFNTNVHGGVIGAILVLLFLLDRGRRASPAGVAIMLAGAVAAWAQLRTAPDASFPHIVRRINPLAAWHAVASAFSPGIALGVAGAAAVLIILLIAVSLRRRADALLFLLLSIVLLNLLYVFVWFGGYRHAGLILVAALLAIWIAGNVPRDAVSSAAALLLNVALSFSVLFAFHMARADVKMDFSGSREMGEFIGENGLDRYPIAAHNMHPTEAVLPWVPGKQFWYAGVGRYGTYMHWNREEEIGIHTPYPVAVGRAIEHFVPRGEPWLLLLNRPIPGSGRGFRLLYATQGPVYRHRDERYWLYEWVGAGEAVSSPTR
ncbi:MAG TPA: hypothetical protein VNA04_13535 [Thermoanaerobaculia bacterium]|nr:hypothetical protein [Thermoanaerobaculia bacterium]